MVTLQSQNHRKIKVGNDLWSVSSTTPCSRPGLVRPGSLEQCSAQCCTARMVMQQPHSACFPEILCLISKTRFFFTSIWNFICFNLCSSPFSLPTACISKKSLAPAHWYPQIRSSQTVIRPAQGPPTSSSSACSTFPCPSPWISCMSFAGLAPLFNVFSCTGESQTGHNTPGLVP